MAKIVVEFNKYMKDVKASDGVYINLAKGDQGTICGGNDVIKAIAFEHKGKTLVLDAHVDNLTIICRY